MRDETKSLSCPLRSAALAAPKTAAIVGARGITSYEELDRMVSGAALRAAHPYEEPAFHVIAAAEVD